MFLIGFLISKLLTKPQFSLLNSISQISLMVILLSIMACSPALKTSSSLNLDESGNSLIPSSGLKLENALDDLPKNQKSLDVICAKSGSDKFRRTFCQPNRPQIKSLRDLYSILGVSINDTNFSCTTNSVSLVRNDVSVLNPRCISFTRVQQDAEALAIGYQRGELTLVEIISRDPQSKELAFYLLDYDLPCEKKPGGCQSGEYFVESSEAGWVNLSFYEDVSLVNTAFDCTNCHQPGGHGTEKKLRMAEASLPWTHWMSSDTDCGKSLTSDFEAAHGGEGFYAGIPLQRFPRMKAENLEFFVNNNGFKGRTHGNDFYNSFQIESEITENPDVLSPTWFEEYERRNLFLGLDSFGGVSMPYSKCKQSDPDRLNSFTKKYRAAVSGQASLASVPFLSKVNKDSEIDLRDRGLLAAQHLDDKQLLERACLPCHNSKVDSSISRAKFNAELLGSNSLATIDRAIERVRMANDDLEKMPPKLFLNLLDTEKQRLINYLASVKRRGN